MNKQSMTDAIVSIKAERGLTWEAIAAEIGVSPVWLASVGYGMSSAKPEVAKKIAEFLDLAPEVEKALSDLPTKIWEQAVATDPCIYRLYEIAGVYGQSMKDVIQEEFGDGIMSAIDFTFDIERVPDPKGDRVLLKMCGKFLPYKSW